MGTWALAKTVTVPGFSRRIDRGLDMGRGRGPHSLSTECRMGLQDGGKTRQPTLKNCEEEEKKV